MCTGISCCCKKNLKTQLKVVFYDGFFPVNSPLPPSSQPEDDIFVPVEFTKEKNGSVTMFLTNGVTIENSTTGTIQIGLVGDEDLTKFLPTRGELDVGSDPVSVGCGVISSDNFKNDLLTFQVKTGEEAPNGLVFIGIANEQSKIPAGVSFFYKPFSMSWTRI